MDQNKSLFDMMPSKTAFWIGFGTAILSLCTLGFIILGSCMLKGTCNLPTDTTAVDKSQAAAGTGAAATAPTAAASVTVSKIAPVDKDDHILGDVNAPVTIVEYSDFQCPYCAKFHATLQKVTDDYAGKVRWVYRHYPLSFHDQAQNAAEAAECAGEQGKFWEYGDKLVLSQDTLGDVTYDKIATDLGLNTTKFDTCLSSDTYLDRITSDTKEGSAVGVSGTPATFIYKTNAKGTDTVTVIKGAQTESAVHAAIDALLK